MLLPYQNMKAHFNPRRLARDVVVATLCALLLAATASARSRTRLQVTLPGAEGHPNGDYGTTLASVGQSSPSSLKFIVFSIGSFRVYWIHAVSTGRTSLKTERVGGQGALGAVTDCRGGRR